METLTYKQPENEPYVSQLQYNFDAETGFITCIDLIYATPDAMAVDFGFVDMNFVEVAKNIFIDWRLEKYSQSTYFLMKAANALRFGSTTYNETHDYYTYRGDHLTYIEK